MARKKTAEDSPNQDENKINLIKSQIAKEYGENILVNADWVDQDDRMVIPVSPAFDIGLSGGIPEGCFTIVTGPPKYGKTTLMLSFSANCQKPEYGGRDVFYLKTEGRFDQKNLQIEGLNRDKFFIVQSTREKVLTAEDFLRISENLIKTCPGCVIIIDSYSSLSTESEMVNDLSGSTRSTGPKLLAAWARRIGQIVPINKNIVVGVMKIVANTSGYGPSKVEQGGNALKYQEDVKLECTKREYLTTTDKGKAFGQKVTWVVRNSALGPPGQEIESYIRYGVGIDRPRELIEKAVELGIIDKRGSWMVVLPDKYEDQYKAQGAEKVQTLLENNPDLFAEVEQSLRDLTLGVSTSENPGD